MRYAIANIGCTYLVPGKTSVSGNAEDVDLVVAPHPFRVSTPMFEGSNLGVIHS